MDYLLLIPALALAFCGVFIFNRLPEQWFCDYGETPPPKKQNRIKPIIGILIFCVIMLLAWFSGLNGLPLAQALIALLFVWLCIFISVSDFIYGILPDQFIIALSACGIALMALDYRHFYFYLLGALVGGGFIYLIGLLGKLLFKAEAMGFGDVKLAGALGLICGLPGVLYALLISVLSGAVAAVPLLFISKEKRRYLAFAPFLCIGAILSFYFKHQINAFFEWYISLF